MIALSVALLVDCLVFGVTFSEFLISVGQLSQSFLSAVGGAPDSLDIISTLPTGAAMGFQILKGRPIQLTTVLSSVLTCLLRCSSSHLGAALQAWLT